MKKPCVRWHKVAPALLLFSSFLFILDSGLPQSLPPGLQETPISDWRTDRPAPPVGCDLGLNPRYMFSPDHHHVALVCGNRKKPAPTPEGCQLFLMIDGVRRSGDYPVLRTPVFSPNGERIAYVTCDEKGYVVWIDDQPRGPFATVGDIAFSQDSQHFLFTAADYDYDHGVGHIFVVTDRQTWAVKSAPLSVTVYNGADPLPAIGQALAPRLPAITFSPDGNHVIWVEQGILMRDGKPGPACEKITGAGFSEDGMHLAAICASDVKTSLLVDDQERRAFDPKAEYAACPTFSPDGKRFAYVIARPLESGGKRKALRGLSDNPIPGTTRSTDLLNGVQAVLLPFQKQRYRFRMVVDGKETDETVAWGMGPMKFSPDGRRLAYELRGPHGTEKRCVVLDGHEGKLYDDILSIISFVDNNTISYVATEAGKPVKVTHTVP